MKTSGIIDIVVIMKRQKITDSVGAETEISLAEVQLPPQMTIENIRNIISFLLFILPLYSSGFVLL